MNELLHWPRGEAADAPPDPVRDAIEHLIDTAEYREAALLAETARDHAASAAKRRRYHGLLRFALSRLPVITPVGPGTAT